MSLAELGLTAEQERLYRQLLRDSQSGLDLAEVGPVLAELRALGLVDEAQTALSPAAAIDLLVRRRIEQTRRQLTELTLAWDVLTELAEEHRSGRPVRLVEHLPTGPLVSQRIRSLIAADPREFVHLKTEALGERGRGEYDGATRYDLTPFKRALAAGLRSRTLFPAHALADPDQAPYARELHALGDLHRVTTEPVRHLAIVNRQVAFIQADPTQPTGGALQIRQPGVVAMLADVFDGMWRRARDLDDLPLTPLEQQVLNALTISDTDEAAAKLINISVRKFRAHVAELMARLGASTRFQAALRAKEQGWL